MTYVVDLRGSLTDLLQDGLNCCRVAPQHVPQLRELRVVEQSSEVLNAHLPALASCSLTRLGRRVLESLQAGRDAVEKVLDCPFGVVEGGSEGSHALLSGETHAHQLVDLGLLLLVHRRFGFLFLFFLFHVHFLPLFLLFLLLGLLLLFLLGLGVGLCDLVHADDEVSVFDAYFLDSVLVVEGLSLEYDFQSIGCHALDLLDFGLEGGDLGYADSTLSAGSTSIWKTSPFRFLTFSFIAT